MIEDTDKQEKDFGISEEKTYRFEVTGHCELDIKAKNYEEAEKFCEEYMDDLFASDLFTDYEFIEEVVLLEKIIKAYKEIKL